jgi:Arc/MetJ family transcription regulator
MVRFGLKPLRVMYTLHMKRTNLVLDPHLLEEATRVLGLKTYSATVNHALAEIIRLSKVQGLRNFFGTGLWEGDLAAMREDRFSPHRQRVRSSRRRQP